MSSITPMSQHKTGKPNSIKENLSSAEQTPSSVEDFFKVQFSLQYVFKAIDQMKLKRLSYTSLCKYTWQEFRKECKEQPEVAVAKAALTTLAVGTFYPLALGTVACFAAFYAAPPSDMFSSDKDVASNAAGLYGNIGHGVGYPVHGLEIATLTLSILFYSSYQRVRAQLITKIYKEILEDEERPLSTPQRNLLYNRLQADLNSNILISGDHPIMQ